jgi:hypothetical protein
VQEDDPLHHLSTRFWGTCKRTSPPCLLSSLHLFSLFSCALSEKPASLPTHQ